MKMFQKYINKGIIIKKRLHEIENEMKQATQEMMNCCHCEFTIHNCKRGKSLYNQD